MLDIYNIINEIKKEDEQDIYTTLKKKSSEIYSGIGDLRKKGFYFARIFSNWLH